MASFLLRAKKNFGTSQDFHKSEAKLKKKIDPSNDLLSFKVPFAPTLNPILQKCCQMKL
jgi:hypothetical protein